MLKRIHLLEKKNKKKTEYERGITLLKQVIERELKVQNSKSNKDFVNLSDLLPETMVFVPSEKFKETISTIQKYLEEYVNINNEYVKVKQLEDKAKAKKPRTTDANGQGGKYELLTYNGELNRTLKELENVLPEQIRKRMVDQYLSILFGIEGAGAHLPPKGNQWSKIQAFATVYVQGKAPTQQ